MKRLRRVKVMEPVRMVRMDCRIWMPRLEPLMI